MQRRGYTEMKTLSKGMHALWRYGVNIWDYSCFSLKQTQQNSETNRKRGDTLLLLLLHKLPLLKFSVFETKQSFVSLYSILSWTNFGRQGPARYCSTDNLVLVHYYACIANIIFEKMLNFSHNNNYNVFYTEFQWSSEHWA